MKWKKITYLLQPSLKFATSRFIYRNMLLLFSISLLGLATTHSAASTIPSLNLLEEMSPLPADPRNLSDSAIDTPTDLNSSIPPPTTLDPRLTYDKVFDSQILDKNFTYLNTMLALADLSTKGWLARMSYETLYSFSSYGDVTIRIHAKQNPSSLQYRYAIWGLYSAVREIEANSFKACVLTLYWSPIAGKSRHAIGYVSILGASSSPSIDAGKFNGSTLDSGLPTLVISQELIQANLTTVSINSSIAPAIGPPDAPDLKVGINPLDRALSIDTVFHVIYQGILYLASYPQTQGISQPGVVTDDVSHTFLRWDCTHLTVQRTFEYRYAILALLALPLWMYKNDRFEEVRVTVYVDESEVGRGWLYKQGAGEASNVK